MSERAVPRVTRLLGILTYLERHGEAPFSELAKHFGVSVDQIRKDIELLWVSGVPGHAPEDLIDFDAWAFDDDVASLTNSQGVGQVRLSPREAVALIGALQSVVASGTAPAAATSALAKLSQAVGDGGAVRTLPAGTLDQSIASALQSAVNGGRVVTVTYTDVNDRRSERVIEPHKIVVIDGTSYVECFCRRAGDYRTLRVDRMSAAVVGEEPVETAPHPTGGFSLDPAFEATVIAKPDAAWLLDSLPGSRLTFGEGLVTAVFGVADTGFATSRLLAIAPDLVSVEPVELRQALVAHARSVRAAQA